MDKPLLSRTRNKQGSCGEAVDEFKDHLFDMVARGKHEVYAIGEEDSDRRTEAGAERGDQS